VVSGRCRANDPSRIAMMMASGDEMRGEQGDALATVAKSVVETLEEIEETRQNICRLAWKEKQAPKPIATGATPCALSTPFTPAMEAPMKRRRRSVKKRNRQRLASHARRLKR